MTIPPISTGGYTCILCGEFVAHHTTHICRVSIGGMPTGQVQITPMGWTCPSCGRGLAPWISVCPHPLPTAYSTGAVEGVEGSAATPQQEKGQ